MRHGAVLATALLVSVIIGCASTGNRDASSAAPSSSAPSIALSTDPLPVFSPPLETTFAPTNVPAETASQTEPSSPTASPFPQPSPKIAPSPPPSSSHAAGRAASDRFWENWYETCFFGAFPIVSSLAEITSQSDLVVQGTIVNVYVTRPGDGFQLAYAEVSINEILKGEPMSEQFGTIEVQIGHARSDLEELRSSLPAHDHLWFLVHEHTFDERNDPAGYTYHPTDYTQVSVLRDIGGVVAVIKPEWIAGAYARRQYPVPLDGTSFEELVQRVRDLTTGSSSVSGSLARVARPAEAPRTRFAAC